MSLQEFTRDVTVIHCICQINANTFGDICPEFHWMIIEDWHMKPISVSCNVRDHLHSSFSTQSLTISLFLPYCFCWSVHENPLFMCKSVSNQNLKPVNEGFNSGLEILQGFVICSNSSAQGAALISVDLGFWRVLKTKEDQESITAADQGATLKPSDPQLS